jgi:serine/threonine protein kinase
MSHPLSDHTAIDQPPSEYLRSVGTVFAEFGRQTQDSGNVSYGVQVGDERFFVKTAGLVDDPRPFLDHPARVALLRNAVRLSASVTHPLLPRLHGVIESPDGPLLVYPWLDGELLGVAREQRDDPRSAFQRFRALPASTIQVHLDALYDLHAALARAGWVAVDFYDGSLLYDFAAGRLWAVDLDMYRDAPFRNEMGEMFGSSRFMAPEEVELGALIDEQTTVFVMGRTALVFLSDGTLDAGAFRGPRALFDVAAQACRPERALRFASMAAFYDAWRAAKDV